MQRGNPLRGALAKPRATEASRLTASNQVMQRLMIQPKLTVNRPCDRFEQQADRVSDAVMRMPEQSNPEAVRNIGSTPVSSLQRVCSDCQEELTQSPKDIQRLCSHCKEQINSDEEGNIQAKE